MYLVVFGKVSINVSRELLTAADRGTAPLIAFSLVRYQHLLTDVLDTTTYIMYRVESIVRLNLPPFGSTTTSTTASQRQELESPTTPETNDRSHAQTKWSTQGQTPDFCRLFCTAIRRFCEIVILSASENATKFYLVPCYRLSKPPSANPLVSFAILVSPRFIPLDPAPLLGVDGVLLMPNTKALKLELSLPSLSES